MSDRKPDPGRICWDCGAPNDAGSSECWLCQRRDWNRYPDLQRRHGGRVPRRRGPFSTIAGLMVGVAVVAVAIGLFREAPGAAVLLLVCAAPALAITEAKARGRSRRGDPMSIGERIVRVVALMILIPILVIVALVVALLVFCSLMPR